MIALETRSLHKSFGSLAATQDVSLAFEAGLRYAIIGPNGAGKTTYFNLLAGNLRPDSGTILFAGRDVTRLDVTSRAKIGIARSFQRNNLFSDFTVRDNLMLACALRAGTDAGVLAADAANHIGKRGSRRDCSPRWADRRSRHHGPPAQLRQPAPA